ncbi:hypothetical protein HanRHA438_Chr07g0292891 [Helianthus annuus]|uniref:Uncharacterized protein n=1 Tax=Helianthus annuus TaxID=4232 RepID=A0A9K3IIY8_HELAN|nr:hypothetical protein HanXRQr2_Chr07g0282331 [Helianthus annuus]KAJ0549309.1 hypothetical protein HanHA300_Chr07g0232081 [Helianthus annuus]KAJ0562263.1 hypothetical protein HanHA89_Chr07g0249241 [Helianthus annuus]KAJ0727639.1 hypothetical protein HanLR1_Chr07g0232051 [Helianthus annuus]KAJ0903714.1 hypothetical protein HanPSC8_Chr07g0273161 [Helianthus annuus]
MNLSRYQPPLPADQVKVATEFLNQGGKPPSTYPMLEHVYLSKKS